jgi:hypothetical protein
MRRAGMTVIVVESMFLIVYQSCSTEKTFL